MKTRSGFTVIELLVVVVIGTLLVLGTLQVLTTNRKTYTIQNADLQNQQQLRASLEVLLTELRGVSSRGGDILAADANSIRIRSMDDFGVVCDVGTSSFGILPFTNTSDDPTPFGVETLLVFVDGDPLTSVDDTWEEWTPGVELGSSLTAGTCDGQTSQVVDVQGDAETIVQAGDLLVGAPVRNFDTHTWEMSDANYGEWFLTLNDGGGAVEVVGPLAPDSRGNPLTFRYYDEDGNELTALSTAAQREAIRQIELTVSAWSPVLNKDGTNVQDDLTVRVYTRN